MKNKTISRKLIYSIIIFLSLIVFVSASVGISLLLEDAVYNVPLKNETIRYEGDVTFNIVGEGNSSCYINANSMNFDVDFKYCLDMNFEGQEITNATDWFGRKWKTVTIGNETYRSFDAEKLSTMKCKYEGKSYDSELDGCV